MSHQTGIKANDKLKKFFSQCRDGKTRAFKVSIVEEQLALADQKKVGKSWDVDFENIVPTFIVEDSPCYLFYRFDTKNANNNYDWLLISWIPDTAPIRQKMLYASTKATLKQEFGSGNIKDELQATTLEEVTFKGYMKRREDLKGPAPLTNREEEMKELLKHERASASVISIETKHKTLSGVTFPITKLAEKAILNIGQNLVDYVQLKIDMEREEINLVISCKLIDISELSAMVPNESARYHLYRFKHTYESDNIENLIFIYSMPGYTCSIKERMLYSSCKASLLEAIEILGVKIDKKLEVDCGDDLTEDYFMNEMHPQVNLHRPIFDKPKGPPNRGARRITRIQK